MRDCDIRNKLDVFLRQQHADGSDTLIRHEMGLCAGQRRVDIALLNGEISGYEIKSDVDSLIRLLGQADVYGRVLDRVTLVTTSRHLEKSMTLLPTWWGVMIAKQERGCVTLETVREPETNPELDPFALAQFLWREEALEELKKRGLSKGISKKARFYLWQALVQAIPIEDLRDLVRERIKARPSWIDAPRHGQNGARPPIVATQ
ncbi:MAG: sce7726 family protein [Chloroflexi bacterium]|nr:sce7726 family protein [Chloroflexota bacterium]